MLLSLRPPSATPDSTHPLATPHSVNSPRFLRTDSLLLSTISPCPSRRLPESILLDFLLHWPERTHRPLWSLINISLDPVDVYPPPSPRPFGKAHHQLLHKRWYRSSVTMLRFTGNDVKYLGVYWEREQSFDWDGNFDKYIFEKYKFDSNDSHFYVESRGVFNVVDNCFYSHRITDVSFLVRRTKKRKKEEKRNR